MESLGQTFKSARERKRTSLSQAAAKTRIKVQILEGLERNDFSAIPAPTYGRGFIKMYAEFLGLDPAPLLKEYAERTPAKSKTDRSTAMIPHVPAPAPAAEAAEESSSPAEARSILAGISWKLPATLVGSILAVVIISSVLSRCSASGGAEKPAKVAAPAPSPKRNPLALIREPSEPFIAAAGAATNQP